MDQSVPDLYTRGRRDRRPSNALARGKRGRSPFLDHLNTVLRLERIKKPRDTGIDLFMLQRPI